MSPGLGAQSFNTAWFLHCTARLAQEGEASSALLAQLRRGVAGSGMARWHESWQKVVLPLLRPQPEGAAR